MTSGENISQEIKQLQLDTSSALAWAGQGRVEEWVHHYLLSGKGGSTNSAFSEGLKREKRWWNGPVQLTLESLSPAVGPDPGLEYVVDEEQWQLRISHMAKSFSSVMDIPPLIAEYRAGELSLRDGNTRYGAMKSLGWTTCWVIIWYNAESDYRQHNEVLLKTSATLYIG
jgi:hypothetical protein